MPYSGDAICIGLTMGVDGASGVALGSVDGCAGSTPALGVEPVSAALGEGVFARAVNVGLGVRCESDSEETDGGAVS